MVQGLSNADLSRLWLLRGRHTTKQAVEKAIHYGLPLWPEAVHMARSYHRAKKDLAGGKYYIIGSEFTETEFDSPYSYRELGRYPEDWEKRNKYQKAIEELEKLEFSKDSSGVNAHGDASSLFRSLSKSLKDASARACFENDKSKHIALLLGGVSAGELEILQSERNSLDICQISDDAVSECEVEDGSCRSDHDLLRCQRQDLSQILIHDKVDEFEEKTERKELCSERETAYDIDRGPNKPCQGRNEESMDHGSANASNLKQQSTTVKRNVKNFTLKRLDFSAYEEKLHRMCEENYLRPCSPVRSFARILPKEEWIYHYAMSRNEKNAPTTAQRDTSMSATSEEEDVKHSSEKVEGIKQEDNSEESEELCADSIPKVLDGSVSVEEKPKRSFVYPFDDTSSIVGSDYSDDAIGTDIFMEISEHRREEGASSPSACSDNSKVALPPNVFVWLPQTCDIELLTRFRAPSPNAIFEVVLPSPSTAFLDLSFTAPMVEEVLVYGAFIKSFNHSGAFALNRGPLRSKATPLKCNASMIASSSVDYCIHNKLCNECYCGIEFSRHAFLRDFFNCTVPQSVEVNTSQAFVFDTTSVTGFTVGKLADCSSTSSSHSCFAVKSVDVSFSWVFDLEAGGGATLVLPSKSRRRTSCYDKVCIRKRKRKSPLSSAKRWKRSDSMKECLMLLETGSMPSQIIDVTPCLVEGAAVKMEFDETLSFSAVDNGFRSDELDQTLFEDSVSQRSDRSHSPDRLIIVEDLDAEQEQRVSKDIVTELSNCQMTSVRLAPVELNFENMGTCTEEVRLDADAVAQLSSKKTGSKLADIYDFQVSHVDFQSQNQVTFFPQESVEFKISRRMDSPGSDTHFELSATSIRQPFFDTIEKQNSPVLVKKKLRRVDRNKTKVLNNVIAPAALVASKSSKVPTDADSCRPSKVLITPESGSSAMLGEITEFVPKKKQGRWSRLLRQNSASKILANESQSLLETPYSFILTAKDRLPCDTTSDKQQAADDVRVNAQIVETTHQRSPGDRVCAQIENVDIVRRDPIQDAIATPLRDIQSQSDLAVASVLNDELLTKKGLQSEHKTPFVPSKAVNPNVLPSKETVRKLNQISLPKSNSDVIPSFTLHLTEVSETNECLSQSVELLSNDIQSQSDLAVAPITKEETVPRKRFRRILEPEIKAGCISCEGRNSIVLPSKGSIRKHKQVSLPKSNADVLPSFTLAEVSETNECSSHSVELLPNDIQSQSDLAVAPITNEETVPRKRFRRILEPENKAGCILPEGDNPNVLPSKGSVRRHRQVSLPKSNADVLPSFTLAEVSETNECSSHSVELLPNDIQSQSDLAVAPITNEETVPRKRFRRILEPENKAVCILPEGDNPNVLPSKGSVRKHKQVSLPKSNADVLPSFTLAEVSETSECSSQRVEPLSSDIQSQSNLADSPVTNDETVLKKRFRRVFEREIKAGCISCEGKNSNVLPANKGVRKRKQLSVLKSDVPSLTSAELSETCECSIQSRGTLSSDIQSQSDLAVSPVTDDAVTRRRFRRGAQPGNKTTCVPSKAENPNVLPFKSGVRKHKQLSVLKSNSDMTPFSTLAEVSETYECLSQNVKTLSSDIQSQSGLSVASVINDEAFTRVGFRRGAQPENETACIPFKAEIPNVLPSNRDVREHNQLSVPKTNAEVTRPFTVEDVPEACECSSDDVYLLATHEEDSDQRSFRSSKRRMKLENLPRSSKRRKNDAVIGKTTRSMRDTRTSRCAERSPIIETTRSQAVTLDSVSAPVKNISTSRRRKNVGQKSLAAGDVNDDIVLIKSGHRRNRSSTPPILIVAENTTASFVPIKLDNNRSAETFILPTCNWGEAIKAAVCSSDSAEILNALALGIIIKEASVLSLVNLATFAQLVFNLLGVGTSTNIFGKLMDGGASTLPANFTTIFERTTPLQLRHRLDYNSFSSMLIGRLPENGLHALTLDSRKVSMLKITKFIDTITEAVDEVCEQLRTRNDLSKGEIEIEKDLSSDVHQLITSRYVETMMNLADKCNEAVGVPLEVIADRFHLLLYGWDSFLQQGGVLRVRLQLSPGKSHPGIVDITTGWLDQIDAVLSRAQATLSTRTSAFAVSLAQEKNVMSKIWHKMAAQTSSSCDDESFIHCSECKLYFHNEDTDFMHNRVFHHKSRECEECYDMFHTLLGLDLHMVGRHKRTFVEN